MLILIIAGAVSIMAILYPVAKWITEGGKI